MGSGGDDNNTFKHLFGFGIPSEEPTRGSNSLADLLGVTSSEPTTGANYLADLLRAISPKAAVPPPPADNTLAVTLKGLSRYATPQAPALRGISFPSPRPPSKPLPRVGGVSWAQLLVGGLLKRKAVVALGRVLPGIDDLV